MCHVGVALNAQRRGLVPREPGGGVSTSRPFTRPASDRGEPRGERRHRARSMKRMGCLVSSSTPLMVTGPAWRRHVTSANRRHPERRPRSSIESPVWSGSPGGFPPGPPRIRTCRFPASGSSGVGFATWQSGARCAAAEAGNASAAPASCSSSERPSGFGATTTCARVSAPRRAAGRARRSST